MPSFIEGFAAAGQMQRDALARETGDQLFPNLLYRADVTRHQFEGMIGQSKTVPVPGLLEINTDSRTPGVEPVPDQQDFEFYLVKPEPKGRVVTQNLPANYASAVGPYFQKQKAQVLQAAGTMNRLCRDALYLAYQSGHALVDVSAGGGVTLTVSSLNGFRFEPDPTSQYPVPVSNGAPKAVLRNGVLVAQKIISAVPNDPSNLDGPGVLTLDGASAFVAGDRIDTVDAARIIRPRNAVTVDGIGINDTLTGELVQRAITLLRDNSVPAHTDGYYHIHVPPIGEQAMFASNLIQRQIETRGFEDNPFLKFAMGRGLGCTWFSNNQSPDQATVAASKLVQSRPVTAPSALLAGDIGAEIVNKNGVVIARAIVTGGEVLQEHYVDEMSYMTEAGYLGRVEAKMTENRGIEIRADGVRFLTQAPTDLYGENTKMGWSWTGAFVPPTNRLGGKNIPNLSVPAYKLAVVIEFAIPV